MLAAFALENFRAFRSTGSVPLRPLTVLVGRNSSGKSSLIHALLLLKQSLVSHAGPWASAPLQLSGQFVDVGTFGDVVYRHASSQNLSFVLDFEWRRPQLGVGTSAFGSPLIGRGLLRGLRGEEEWSSRHFHYFQMREPSQQSSTYAGATMRLSYASEAPVGATLCEYGFRVSPNVDIKYLRTRGRRRTKHWRLYVRGMNRNLIGLIRRPFQSLPDLGRVRRVGKKPDESRLVERFTNTHIQAKSDLSSFLSGLRVVGPFRTPPRRLYQFTGLSSGDAGITGEQAVDLLILERILFPRPSDQHLRRGVDHWLRHIGVAQSLHIVDVARRSSLFNVNLRGAGYRAAANIADVGYGVSQVLPVLVQGMLMAPGETYAVQQPELHLHPDAQAALADFFIYLATWGVRVLVETHSEYFLIRLRRRLAEGRKPTRMRMPIESQVVPQSIGRKDVSVVLAQEGVRGGHRIQVAEVDESFSLQALPQNFMSQSVSERLALVAAAKTQ